MCVLRVPSLALRITKSDACAANSSFSYPERYYVFAILCWCLKPWNLSAWCVPTGIREVGKCGGWLLVLVFSHKIMCCLFCHCFHFLLKHQRSGRVWGDVRRFSFGPDWLILTHVMQIKLVEELEIGNSFIMDCEACFHLLLHRAFLTSLGY